MTAIITTTELYEQNISTNTHVQINLCILLDACNELHVFCIFGAFYAPGVHYTEVTKLLVPMDSLVLHVNICK